MSSKNDRWSALSMKERADLINMYITNGISDLKEMKKHYNSFGPGGFVSKMPQYPEVTIKEEPWADAYFKQHPEVAGMAIGAGLNGVDGPRRVIINPYSKNINKDAVLLNERSRHYMEESNFKLPKVTDEQMKKYEGTPYQNDTLNVGRTEAARFISGDKHLLTPEQIEYVNSFGDGGDTDGDGNIILDWIRKQLYDKIDPVGYDYFVDRVKAAILGKGEERYNKARDDIFATYLKIPKDERHNVEGAKKVSDATYTPTKSSDDSTYHKIDLTDKEKDALIYDALRSNANVGDSSTSHVFEQFFGPHQVSRGKDEKGEYVSYYDLWDLDPSSGESKTGEFEFLKSLQKILGAKDMSLGVGEPVEFYDRIYLNDYYGVTPQVDEGDIDGGYLPLAYVEASAGTGSAGQLTGEDYYDAGEESLPTYSKGGKLNNFGDGGDTNNNDSKKTSNNKEALKAKIDKTLFFTIAKQFGFTPKQLQDLAYLFGSDAAVSEKGYAGIEDILRILSPGYKPTNPMDDNKRMFLYGNVNGLPQAENTNGKDFSEYIDATYPGANIKSYQGVINPFDEYVIDVRDKGLLEELAAKGENLYVDADVEYGGQQYNYRDDVASYAFKPVVGNNGLMISAADLYDFGPDYNPAKYDPNASKTDSFLGKLESKLLGFVGNPYILRQDNIPIRFIDYNNASKEDISKAEDLKYAIKNGMMSAKEFDDGTDLDKKLAEVLGNEFLEPITVTAEAKKAKGGKLNSFSGGGNSKDDEEPIYLGELETAVVKPKPIKAELNTYYPIISEYPFTGHSELIIHDNKPFHSPTIITSGGYHPDYNLVTNNCSDATRCAIEQIYGEKIDPFLFTTPGDVRDFLLEKGVDIYKTDKGKDTQYFEIPFATAMDLKNKAIDDIIYQQVMWAEKQREQLQKENPNWDSISFDASMHNIYRSLENEKYKFQPFVDGYEIDENGNYIKANGGKLNMFDMGGDKDAWYRRLYNWMFNDDNNTEETATQENKYLTNDNYLDEVSKFISTFEEFYPNAYEDTHNGKNIWTVGSGLTYLIDDEGNEIKVKKGDTITQEENIKQLNKRLQKNIDYIKSKTKHWDNYPAELKFQLLDAMYNIGASKVWNPETNYIKAIRQYENEKGWENPEYNLRNIFQHADWNLNNKGWLGIRSIMRRNPQSINVEDLSKIYQNNYRDSLRTAYDIKFQNN